MFGLYIRYGMCVCLDYVFVCVCVDVFVCMLGLCVYVCMCVLCMCLNCVYVFLDYA